MLHAHEPCYVTGLATTADIQLKLLLKLQLALCMGAGTVWGHTQSKQMPQEMQAGTSLRKFVTDTR